ncbi:MAG: alpha-galactosidase [Bryobacteraceae bacterium]|nr:alpha-galactosidase [Bryobacteraceae bacterium]
MATHRILFSSLAIASLALLAGCRRIDSPRGGLTLEALRASQSEVRTANPPDAAKLELTREWAGSVCRSRLRNGGASAVRVKEVVLFQGPHELPPETRLYGEGFTMLSQTGGTLAAPEDLGAYTDAKHYKIPQVSDAITVYSVAMLSPPSGNRSLLAFTSCNRFQGVIRLRPREFEIVLDTENLALAAGQTWELEEFTIAHGDDREQLLAGLAGRIEVNHPRLMFPEVPTGWCSWYCFGPEVTFRQAASNLDAIARQAPYLKYVQIDDGYQPNMGDWLDVRPDFGGDMKSLCRRIAQRGFQPAVWVAPFIAEAGSKVFREHPDWFIQNGEGSPLRSDTVSFGGWRRGPWYALDGTHPEARAHIEGVFRTMRQDWGVTYFKLDATFWGALHGGRFHDPNATRIEAYRRGMQALLRGAGGAFVLAGNHPIWPSVGLIHASRSSMDIANTWDSVRSTARENFFRGWQHGRLWLNDPDVVMVGGNMPDNELYFRWSAAYATGGLMLAGDDLAALPEQRLRILRKLAPPTGVAARFADESFRAGVMDLPGKRIFTVFNWDDAPRDLELPLTQRARLEDFWSGEDLGAHDRAYAISGMPPRSARVIVAEAAR